MSGKSGFNPYEDRILSNDKKGLTFFKCQGLEFKSQDGIPPEHYLNKVKTLMDTAFI